jgi:hypothetical protein
LSALADLPLSNSIKRSIQIQRISVVGCRLSVVGFQWSMEGKTIPEEGIGYSIDN